MWGFVRQGRAQTILGKYSYLLLRPTSGSASGVAIIKWSTKTQARLCGRVPGQVRDPGRTTGEGGTPITLGFILAAFGALRWANNTRYRAPFARETITHRWASPVFVANGPVWPQTGRERRPRDRRALPDRSRRGPRQGHDAQVRSGTDARITLRAAKPWMRDGAHSPKSDRSRQYVPTRLERG